MGCEEWRGVSVASMATGRCKKCETGGERFHHFAFCEG